MLGEERKRRSFNVKPMSTGRTDGQTWKDGRNVESIIYVCVCVFQSALLRQPLQAPFFLCGDCLSVGLFGADMKVSY